MAMAKPSPSAPPSAAPGTVARGVIPVTTLGRRHAAVEIPVVVINGARAGPRASGSTARSTATSRKARSPARSRCARWTPRSSRARWCWCPVMNVPAFEAAQRGNPLDTFSYDMNRIYPGRANGYLSERIAGRPCRRDGAGRRHRDLDPLGRRAQLSSTRRSSSTNGPRVGRTRHRDGPGLGLHHVELQPQGQPDGLPEGAGQGRHHRRTRRPFGHLAEGVRPRGPRSWPTRSSTSCATTRCIRARRSTRTRATRASRRRCWRRPRASSCPSRASKFLTHDEEGRPHRPDRQHLRRHAGDADGPGGRHDLRPAGAAERADGRLVLLLLQGRGDCATELRCRVAATSSATPTARPIFDWPGGARVAVNFVLNYEEGSEYSIADGDGRSDTRADRGRRRARARGRPRPRLPRACSSTAPASASGASLRLFRERGLPMTVFAAALALERNPPLAAAIAALGLGRVSATAGAGSSTT